MSDRELLELAAKAAGYKKYYSHYLGRDSFVTYEEAYYSDFKECQVVGEKTMNWNPLNDDGDALRLAVKLHMSVMVFPDPDQRSEACSHKAANFCDEAARHNGGDIYAATRRAIVRAAAEIGKAMP